MHKGDISSKFELKKLESQSHVYALGAMENLKGEIQIFNSESYNSFMKGDSVAMDKSFTKKATLMVYSIVEHWNSFKIPNSIQTSNELEVFIAKKAHENGLDSTKPFAFLVSGLFTSLDWHVINWKEGDTEHSHDKHINSGGHGTLKNIHADLLGFYSNAHHRIFTHHSTNMHIHFKSKNQALAGHVDDLLLGKNLVLLLPKY